MKASELKKLIAEVPDDNDVFLEIDGKLQNLEYIRNGQFFKSTVICARLEYDIIRAEQTLLNCLQFQRHELKDAVLGRIERAIGSDRLNKIITAFDEAAEKNKKEQEENKELIEDIQESINRQEVFDEEPVVAKKVKKATPAKVKSKKDAEAILMKFYSGDKTDGVDLVKAAKEKVGEDKAKEIFNKARNK